MSKTLTEQWREGTLPEGYYYTKLNDDNGTIDMDYCWDDGCFQDHFDNMVEEVLAPVPTYEEFQSYEKCADMLIDVNKKWGKTIKENKRLQEQLKEANAIIEDMRPFIQASMSRQTFTRILYYEDRWGVK